MRPVPLLVLLASAPAAALVVPHQGFLLGATDQPLDTGAGTVPMTFELFAADSGGSAAWSGSCAVPVRAGYYAVGLGDGTCGLALTPTDLPPGAPRWLEVSVGGVTLAPRQVLQPAPAAANAHAIAGLALADLDLRFGTVRQVATGTGLTGGPIDTTGTIAVDTGTGANQIPQLDGSGRLASSTIPTIGDAHLANGSISTGKLAASGATAGGQVLEWNGSAWAPATDDVGASQWVDGSGGAISYSGGNVGVGVASPTALLEVSKTFRGVRNANANYWVSTTGGQDGTSDATLELSGGTSNNGNLAIKARGVGTISFWAAGATAQVASDAERMRIGAGGNVSIGTTSTPARLTVAGASSTQETLGSGPLRVTGVGTSGFLESGVNYNYSGSVGINGWIQAQDGSGGRNLLLNPGGGNVGIGTSNPLGVLDVRGSVSFTQTVTANIAHGGALALTNYIPPGMHGVLTIVEASGGCAGQIYLRGGLHAVTILNDPLTCLATTPTANRLSAYWNGSAYVLGNNRGSTQWYALTYGGF